MNNKFEKIEFCEESYKEGGRFGEINYAKMYGDIAKFIQILLRNGYIMKIWSDDMTVAIEYNYKDEEMAGVSLEWLAENEYIETYAPEKEVEEDV